MLRARIFTALVLVGIFGVELFAAPDSMWLAFCALVAALSAWEWGALVRLGGGARIAYAIAMSLLVALAAPGGWLGAGMLPSLVLFGLSASFWTMIIPVWLRDRWTLPGEGIGLLLGVLVLLPSALALYSLRDYGAWWLLAVMCAVWVADIAAYFSGRRFGRVKLAPLISPGKSREGAYGGMIGVAVFAACVAFGSGVVAPSVASVLALTSAAVLFTVVSIFGDLFESLAKRQAGVKDSSALLPGHGGVLDRIDSLTSTLPLVSLLAYLVVG